MYINVVLSARLRYCAIPKFIADPTMQPEMEVERNGGVPKRFGIHIGGNKQFGTATQR